MILYGLIGYPLTHSFSPAYFKEKFRKEGIKDSKYESFPLERITQLKDLIFQKPEIRGLNVTIPYKEAVIPFLDEMDPVAREIGAVNTILISGGRLKGYNTDISGFETSLKKELGGSPVSALILGTGGSSKAIAFTLHRMGISYLVVSREPSGMQIGYDQIDKALLGKYKLIINCTPSGMFPNINQCPPVPYELLNMENFLFDLIYNPIETLFMKNGKNRGAKVQNGLDMLHLQAEHAWKIWNQ